MDSLTADIHLLRYLSVCKERQNFYTDFLEYSIKHIYFKLNIHYYINNAIQNHLQIVCYSLFMLI